MIKDDSCPRCSRKVTSNALECPTCGLKLRIIEEETRLNEGRIQNW
ncbi:MAG: hypothetical protein ACLFTY_01750 [Candidatus Aenigmatarchaeota archaeon]